MPSEVRHQVDSGQTYPVVRLAGVLDAATAPDVRSFLLEVLAGQPEGLVVDVRQLTVALPDAVTEVTEVARDATAWPGCRLVLVAAPEAGAWREAGLTVRPSVEESFGVLGPTDPRLHLQASLDPVVGAARRSRELVTEACGRWELPDLAGPACIVITEMVNNVVAHAHTPMTVMLGLHGESMSVAVRDDSTHVPRFTGSPVPVTSYGGRGLLLIDSVARQWGSLVLADGKVVWAVLDAHDRDDKQVPSAGMAGQARG
jgi:hypothetical protein